MRRDSDAGVHGRLCGGLRQIGRPVHAPHRRVSDGNHSADPVEGNGDITRAGSCRIVAGSPLSSAASTVSAYPAADNWIEKAVARFGLFALGIWLALGSGLASSVTLGDVVVLLLVPIWIPALGKYRGALLLACVGLVARRPDSP